MKKTAIFWLLLSGVLFPFLLTAQSPIKWGKIPQEHLAIKQCEFDKEAGAVVLADYGEFHYGYRYGTMHKKHIRIKIFSKQEFDLANVEILYYTKDKAASISDLRAQTINTNPDGSLSIHEVAPLSFFDVEISKTLSAKRFSFPAVQEGSIIEYSYTVHARSFYYYNSWPFQSELPTLYSECRINLEHGLDFKTVYQGSRLIAKYKDKSPDNNRWILENLPALRPQPYITTMKDYEERLLLQMDGYYVRSNNLNQSIEHQSALASWGSTRRALLDHEHFGFFFSPKDWAKEMANGLVNEQDSPQEKMRKIYQFVSSNIRWNGAYSIWTQRSPKEVLAAKNANSAEINLLLVLLLRSAGLEANPVLISTRSHGRLRTVETPVLEQFNHVIVCATTDKQQYLLDANDPLRPYQVLAADDLNYLGIVLDKEEPNWIRIEQIPDSRQSIFCTADLSQPGPLTYRLEGKLEGYKALEQRQAIQKQQNKEVQAGGPDLPGFKQLSIKNINYKNVDQPEKPLIFSADAAEVLADTAKALIYLPAVAIMPFEENPFKDPQRWFPVDFGYPFSYSYSLTLTLPATAQVQELPADMHIKLPDDAGEFIFQAKLNDHSLSLISRFSIKKNLIMPQEYNNLRELFIQALAKQKEMIVIKK